MPSAGETTILFFGTNTLSFYY